MQLLRENHQYMFTLIHKFHSRDNEEFQVLSEASNLIVITDEAHRTRYDVQAMNMRKALPNAAFIGFTGTPLIKGENERTREVFGDYVSIYDFMQSVEDGATVPLYYENRIPELELINDQLNEDLKEVPDKAMLNDAEEEKLEREFRQEYHLITRDDRLDTITKDIVNHFVSRGHKGKGMDIRPHRKRNLNERLDEKFKDPDDPLRLVFVCAMWITGFDVPYLLHELADQADFITSESVFDESIQL